MDVKNASVEKQNYGFLKSSLHLKKYLETYGIDKYSTKNDLLILNFLQEAVIVLKNVLSEKDKVHLANYIEWFKNTNPQIQYS